MRRWTILTAAMLTLATAMLAWGLEPGKSADWPKWLGPNGDGISHETGLLDKWPTSGPDRLWTVPAGLGYASPVAVDGKVYLFSSVEGKDTLACLDAKTGHDVWRQVSPAAWVGDLPGTRATPNIEGDFIYTFGGMGDLICRQLKDGQQVWTIDVLKETGAKNLRWGTASCPAIVGDLIYVQTGGPDKDKPEVGVPVAVAVNKKTGKLAWKSQAEGLFKKGSSGYGGILPVESKGIKQLVVFTSWMVFGLDPATGKTLWQVDWTTPPYNLHCTIPTYRDGNLFVTSGYGRGCMMVKLDGVKAEMIWDKKEPHSRFTPAILDGDCLYVGNEGSLLGLHWPDGKELWRNENLNLGLGGGYVRVGDKLIMLADSGRLLLVKATPAECEQISGFSLFKPGKDTDCWTTPLIYQGRLYVKGPAELVCFDISKK